MPKIQVNKRSGETFMVVPGSPGELMCDSCPVTRASGKRCEDGRNFLCTIDNGERWARYSVATKHLRRK